MGAFYDYLNSDLHHYAFRPILENAASLHEARAAYAELQAAFPPGGDLGFHDFRTSIESNWPEAEPPETTSYEAMHYRMSLRQAITLALENERAAERFYRGVAVSSDDADTVRIAGQFADEELAHAAELQRLLQELPENGANLREEDDEPHMPE